MYEYKIVRFIRPLPAPSPERDMMAGFFIFPNGLLLAVKQ